MQINLKTSPVVFYGVKSPNFLVNVYITMARSTCLMGKSTISMGETTAICDKLPEGKFLVGLHTFGFVNQIIPVGIPDDNHVIGLLTSP